MRKNMHMQHYHDTHKHFPFDYIPAQYRNSVKVTLLPSIGAAALMIFVMIGQSL